MRARPGEIPRIGIKPLIVTAIGLIVLAYSVTFARADEQPIELKDAPGLAEVNANCQGCHSLDYVRMNAPFMAPGVWKAEVNKMRAAYGAQIDDEDTAKIVAYLTAHYGAEPQ